MKPKLTNAEVILILAAISHKKKSPAVEGDREFKAHLQDLLEQFGGFVAEAMEKFSPKAIDPKAEFGEIDLEERDWVEVYYAIEWATNENCPGYKELHKEAAALMEKIGPDGDNMYG